MTSSTGYELALGLDEAGNLLGVSSSDGREMTVDYTAGDHFKGRTFTAPGGAQTLYFLDEDDRVFFVADKGVPVLMNTYDDEGRVEVQWNAGGEIDRFCYYPGESRTDMIDQDTAETTSLVYDEHANLVSKTDQFEQTLTVEHDSDGNLLFARDRAGHELAAVFDDHGRPESVTEGAPGDDPVITTYEWDTQGRLEATEHPVTGRVEYTYDGANRTPSTITRVGDPNTTADDAVTVNNVEDVHPGAAVLERVTWSEDPDGVRTEFGYDPDTGRLEWSEDALENRTLFDVEIVEGVRTDTTTSPEANVTVEVFDPAGRLVSSTDAEDAETVYEYHPVTGRLSKVVDPTSAATEYFYDGAGRQAKVSTPAGSTYMLYDRYGQPTFTLDPAGGVTARTWGPLGRLASSTDELGRSTGFEYDLNGNQTKVTAPDDAEQRSEYDARGRVTTTYDGLDRVTETHYNALGQLDWVKDPTGAQTFTDYDDHGRVHKVTDPRGGETVTTYTTAGRVDTVTDPAGGVTQYVYDDAGRQASVVAPGGLETELGYDGDGRVTTVTSPGGLVTTTTYDGVGRVLTETDPAGVVVTNTWSARGELLTRSTSGAGTVEFHYDAAGNLEWVDDALDNRTWFTYDAMGRELTRTDAHNKEWATTWNAAGEKTSVTDPLNRTTSYTYDLAGRLESVTDPSGRVITNTWDAAGQLEGWTAAHGEDTLDAVFSYDPAGRRTTATVDGRTWTYAYNTAGDQVAQTNPQGRTLMFDYDEAGRRTRLRHVDGTWVAYDYDTAGRVESITPAQTLADTFTAPDGSAPDSHKWAPATAGGGTAEIDDNALALEVTATSGSTAGVAAVVDPSQDSDTVLTYRFDSNAAGTVLRVAQNHSAPGEHYSVTITADNATATLYRTTGGTPTVLDTFSVPVDTDPHRIRLRVDGTNVTARVWDPDDPEPGTWDAEAVDGSPLDPGTPQVVVEGDNNANTVVIDDWSHLDLTNPPEPLVVYSWDDDGHLIHEDLPGASERSWSWDDGQLVELDQTAPGATAVTALTYDTAGRIATETKGGITTTYGYDVAGQLLSATPSTGPASVWTYDDLGRRDTHTIGTDTIEFVYDDAGQLESASPDVGDPTAFAFDGAGRRVTETTGTTSTVSYGYDPAGRFTTYALDGDTQQRSLDPYGSPDTLTNTIDTTDTLWHLDWDHTSLAELTAITSNSTGTTALTRVPGAPWATATRGPDTTPVGSDAHRSTLPTTGTDLARADTYTPFGQPTGTNTLVPTLGYRAELTTGALTHLRARDYHPHTAAFTTTDPLPAVNGTPTLANPYHYTNNNPSNMVDPTGMRPGDNDFTWGYPPGSSPELRLAVEREARRRAREAVRTWQLGSSGACVASQLTAGVFLGASGSLVGCFVIGKSGYFAVGSASGGMAGVIPDVESLADVKSLAASLTAGRIFSNASDPASLRGPNLCIGMSAGAKFGGAFEVCLGFSGDPFAPGGLHTYTGFWTAYVGFGLVWGFEGHVEDGRTGVTRLRDRFRARLQTPLGTLFDFDPACAAIALSFCPPFD